MNEIVKNKYHSGIKFFWISIFFIIGIWIAMIHLDNYGILRNINIENDVTFKNCEEYIFNEKKTFWIKIDTYIHTSQYNVLENQCNKTYPNKRDFIIEHQSIKKSYLLWEQHTKTEIIKIPENIVLDKSIIDIEIKIPSPNITYDVTFFWFSLWKIQNKNTIRIWAIDNNVLNKSYKLSDAYYDGDIEFILTNLKWNDIEVNYTVDFYTQS
jgi:hypothetical protein